MVTAMHLVILHVGDTPVVATGWLLVVAWLLSVVTFIKVVSS